MQGHLIFLQTDFFHNAHLGTLKSFTSPALVSLVEADPPLPCLAHCNPVGAKFQELTRMYKSFFRPGGVANHGSMSWIVTWCAGQCLLLAQRPSGTRAWQQCRSCGLSIGLDKPTLLISGILWWNQLLLGCNNVALLFFVCVCFVIWLAQIFQQRLHGFDGWACFCFQAAGAKAMNVAVTFLYDNGLWLRANKAKKLSRWLFCIRGQYMPFWHRRVWKLANAAIQCIRKDICSVMLPWNCFAFLKGVAGCCLQCQQQEDYIGKPSRISRKTNVRQAHRSILWRSMINITESLAQAEIDQRGKHAWLTDPCDIYASRSSEFQSYLFAFWLALAMFGSGSVRENRRWMKSADVDQLDRSKMEKNEGNTTCVKKPPKSKGNCF